MPSYAWKRTLSLLLLLVAAGCESPTALDEQDGALVLTPTPQHSTLQATPAGYIRIGVVPAATSIVLGSPSGDFTVTNKETGAVLFGAGGDVQVDLLSTGTTRTRYWLQTACTGNTTFRDDWVSRAHGYGYETLLEHVPAASCWRLLLGTMPPNAG